MAQGSSNPKLIVRSGVKGSTTSADITSTPIDTNTQALDVSLKNSLPTGTNTIGKLALNDGIDIGDVTINNASIAVTDNGTSLTVDAPIATPVYVRLSNGTSAVDAIPITDNGSSITVDGSVSVSNFPATQPVSGTVTVSQATASNLNATVTGTVSALQSGTWNIGSITTFPTAITTDTAAIKTSVQLLDDAVGTDGTAVATGMLRVGGTDGTNNQTLSVNTSGHLNIADGGNSITVDGTVGISGTVPVSGTFWQATQPVSGTVTVSQATAANLNATVTGTVAATQSGTWNIGSITTLPSLPAGTNNIGSVSFGPNSLVANAPTNISTTAYAASLIIKASAGVLYAITGFNSRSSGQFIQLHDSATLPADTAVPKIIFYVESNSNFSFDLGVYGRGFSNGIVICNSSSGPTKTIGAADCWFDVQYK